MAPSTPLTAPITVRRFAAADQVAVQRLIVAGLTERWGVVDPDLNTDLSDIATSFKNGGFWIAESDGIVVGTGGWHCRSAQQAEIVRMSVATHHRRTGVGRAVLNALLSDVCASGITTVILETNDVWHSAIAFYLANGFAITRNDNSEFGPITWFQLRLES